MIKLNRLPKITQRGKKRVGRGKRGRRGAKSGRGTKGSLKRGKIALYFEGGALPLTKRLPMLRGKGKHKRLAPKPVVINVERLNVFRNNSVVNLEKLIKQGLVDKDEVIRRGVKILGRGTVKKKLKLEKIPVSRGAREKVEKVGGQIL